MKSQGTLGDERSLGVDKQDQIWHSLLCALDGDEVVNRRLEDRMIAELESYRSLDRSELRRIGPDEMIHRLAAGSSQVDPEHLAHFVAGGELRARQGVSATDMVLAYRIWHEELRTRAREVLPAGPDNNAILLRFIDRITVWIDAAMVAAMEGHRATELDLKRHADYRNASVVRALLLGGSFPAALSRDAIAPFIDHSQPVWAVRVGTTDSTSGLRAVEEFLLGDRREGTRGRLTLIDGDLCGFVYRLPANASAAPAAVGIGGPVLAEHLPHAFSLATRALRTATALGCTGVYDIGSLGLAPAVLADREIGDMAVRRILTPVETLSRSGENILETVQCYLENNLRLDVTAKEMWAHVNTVRYRLNRFEAYTGTSLRDVEDLALIWWALARRRLTAEDTPAEADPTEAAPCGFVAGAAGISHLHQ
jgi:PucR C-terminal helix-turn-helix domain